MKKIIEIVFVFFVSLTFTNCESSDCVEILQAESTCSNLPYLEFVVPMILNLCLNLEKKSMFQMKSSKFL